MCTRSCHVHSADLKGEGREVRGVVGGGGGLRGGLAVVTVLVLLLLPLLLVVMGWLALPN